MHSVFTRTFGRLPYSLTVATTSLKRNSRPSITDATLLGETNDKIIYQLTVELEESIAKAFTTEYIDSAQLESATISKNQWQEKKLFKDYERFNEFRMSCENHGISLDLLSITPNPSLSDEPSQDGLTDRQREALTLALSRGYYESPRQVTAQELAEELGISNPVCRVSSAVVSVNSSRPHLDPRRS